VSERAQPSESFTDLGDYAKNDFLNFCEKPAKLILIIFYIVNNEKL